MTKLEYTFKSDVLFKAETEEELAKIQALEVAVMEQAIEAYRHITATDEFKELERQRHYAAHNRASALDSARREGVEMEREKWLSVVANKDAILADRDAALAHKDAIIAELRAQFANQNAKP
ncbi:MAG: hypothetical protein LBS19_08035 [Clostridiales bacterium]|jgi:hypothetical protein|nr:hypothetical protein [Clostridiales bacterium]